AALFFQSQQELLAGQAAPVACELTITANHSVAGHHDGYLVLPIGDSHCPAGRGSANVVRLFPVTPCLTVGDLEQSVPDLSLKRSTQKIKRNIESTPLPCEVLSQFTPQ